MEADFNRSRTMVAGQVVVVAKRRVNDAKESMPGPTTIKGGGIEPIVFGHRFVQPREQVIGPTGPGWLSKRRLDITNSWFDVGSPARHFSTI